MKQRIPTIIIAALCSIAFLFMVLPLIIEGRGTKSQQVSLHPITPVEKPKAVEVPKIAEAPKPVEAPKTVETPKPVEIPKAVEPPKAVPAKPEPVKPPVQALPAKPPVQMLGNGVELINDISVLPNVISKTRDRLLEAASSGDIKRLKTVFEMNEVMPIFARSPDRDPITYWKRKSGDGEGREVLSALANILNMPPARINIGTPQEMVVYPYMAQLPLSNLTPEQKVDMYRLLTPQDVESMSKFGKYIFYRVGIGKDGTLHYFMDGL